MRVSIAFRGSFFGGKNKQIQNTIRLDDLISRTDIRLVRLEKEKEVTVKVVIRREILIITKMEVIERKRQVLAVLAVSSS